MSVELSKIKISPTESSSLPATDLNNIPFGGVFTDPCITACYQNGKWTDLVIKPLENFSLHPANLALHYGQSIFEGMKASSDSDGNPLSFRPSDHAKRLTRSAARMCMPAFPEVIFIVALTALERLGWHWVA